MPPSATPTQLYGGAMTCTLPGTYVDGSTLREVPSNQEVFVSADSAVSVVIELLERAAPPAHPCPTAADALRYHYRDIVDDDDTHETSREHVGPAAVAAPEGMPEGTEAWRMVAAQEDAKEGKTTVVCLTVVRLVRQGTDVLVAVNVPFVEGEGEGEEEDGGVGRLVREGVEAAEVVVGSLRVVDWGLFEGEGEDDEMGEG